MLVVFDFDGDIACVDAECRTGVLVVAGRKTIASSGAHPGKVTCAACSSYDVQYVRL